jgi:hypothetical protein
VLPLWLLLFIFILLIEHEVESGKSIRTVTIGYGAHGRITSEGTKNNRRTTR